MCLNLYKKSNRGAGLQQWSSEEKEERAGEGDGKVFQIKMLFYTSRNQQKTFKYKVIRRIEVIEVNA